MTSKLQAIQAQEQSLTGQVQAADYHLSQLQTQIAANQQQVAKDQAEVTKDQSQLRTQAISDYTSSGTSSQVTQMFSSNPNTSGIRSEYSSIATGNVTTTIDNLHTAQAQLQATQAALQQQQASATTTRNTLQSSENSAQQLAAQYKGTLNSVDAKIQADVIAQQQAAAAQAKAAAAAAFNAKVAQAQKAQAAAQTVAQTTHGNGGGSTATATATRADVPTATGSGGHRWRHPGRREPAPRALRLGWRDPRGRLRLLGPGPMVVRPGRHLTAPHVGCPVRGHHPHPAGRYPSR